MGNSNNELTKEQRLAILQKAAADLTARYNFVCTIEQGMLVIQANWKDTTYINGPGLTREQRSYRHIVRIKPNGKYATLDVYVDDYQSVGLGGLVIRRDAFSGKAVTFNWEAQIGKNNQTGEKGLIVNRFSSRDIQAPVKEYFNNLGFKYQRYSLSDDWHGIQPNMRLILGAMFTVFPALMIPGIMYSVFTEEDKVLYGGIAAFIISFVVFGLFVLISGIKDMIKQKRDEEWD